MFYDQQSFDTHKLPILERDFNLVIYHLTKYRAKKEYIIGDDGTVEVTFVCEKEGPIECAANSISTLYQAITGWDSVVNPKAGVVGRNLESQQQFEQRRRQSVAGNAVNSVDSIMAGLLKLVDDTDNPICQDAYVTENSTGETLSTGGVSLKPHSIYVCVAALDSEENQQEIAKVIWNKKPPGCAMNGDKTVIIEDDTKDDNGEPLYSTPPKYDITYSYAKTISIKFYIEMARPQFMPNNAIDQIKEAVYKAFTGDDGSIRPRIGGQIFASDFYIPIQSLGTWARIISIQIGRNSGDSDSVQMGINEMPTLTKDDITVVING